MLSFGSVKIVDSYLVGNNNHMSCNQFIAATLGGFSWRDITLSCPMMTWKARWGNFSLHVERSLMFTSAYSRIILSEGMWDYFLQYLNSSLYMQYANVCFFFNCFTVLVLFIFAEKAQWTRRCSLVDVTWEDGMSLLILIRFRKMQTGNTNNFNILVFSFFEDVLITYIYIDIIVAALW